MPHIDNDVKLDFQDVLIRPKRSELVSRSQVDVMRTFKFRNSKQELTAVSAVAPVLTLGAEGCCFDLRFPWMARPEHCPLADIAHFSSFGRLVRIEESFFVTLASCVGRPHGSRFVSDLILRSSRIAM